MSFCTTCGASLQTSAQFCTGCGGKVETVGAEQIQGAAITDGLYYIAYGTGQTVGPLTCDAVKSLIAEQKIKVSDSIRRDGSDPWMPIVQSEFAPLIAQQANMVRLAASTCPGCGAGMAVVIKRSKAGLVLIIVGLLTTPLFGIGIPIFVVGFILRWGRKGQAAYQCPRCNYATH